LAKRRKRGKAKRRRQRRRVLRRGRKGTRSGKRSASASSPSRGKGQKAKRRRGAARTPRKRIPTPRKPSAPLRDWLVRWSFVSSAERKYESPSREVSWVTRARTEEEAIANVGEWIIADGLDSDFDYRWVLHMDEQELWNKSALILQSRVVPHLTKGEVQERQ